MFRRFLLLQTKNVISILTKKNIFLFHVKLWNYENIIIVCHITDLTQWSLQCARCLTTERGVCSVECSVYIVSCSACCWPTSFFWSVRSLHLFLHYTKTRASSDMILLLCRTPTAYLLYLWIVDDNLHSTDALGISRSMYRVCVSMLILVVENQYLVSRAFRL